MRLLLPLSLVERGVEFESSMRLPENEEEIDWRGAWLGERGREEFWYRKSENAERAGKKGQSNRKYSLSIP